MQSVLSGRAGKSKAMPFLTQPPNLDGSMPGDVGFDPLGISTFLDVKWLREAELKHGRICMLAWTGCLVQVSICVDVRMLALVCVYNAHLCSCVSVLVCACLQACITNTPI